MANYFLVGPGLIALSFVYWIVSTFISDQYHARKAKKLGAQPPPRRHARLPFGIDLVRRMGKADEEHVIPDLLTTIHGEMGCDTWVQSFLGTTNFTTADPKNIQALLATQFNDFEIGALRRNNFFPMFGNGIFTSVGKMWYASPSFKPKYLLTRQGTFASNAATSIRPRTSFKP